VFHRSDYAFLSAAFISFLLSVSLWFPGQREEGGGDGISVTALDGGRQPAEVADHRGPRGRGEPRASQVLQGVLHLEHEATRQVGHEKSVCWLRRAGSMGGGGTSLGRPRQDRWSMNTQLRRWMAEGPMP